MANTGKQSPLGVNVLSSLLKDIGFRINPVAQEHMGVSKTNFDYVFGTVVGRTCLRLLTWAINDGYNRGSIGGGQFRGPTLTNGTYDNLITIGNFPNYTIPALGNSKPSTYVPNDPSNMWCAPDGTTGKLVGGVGQATTGYAIAGNIGQGQSAKWYPYLTVNPNHSVTQWGYVRLHALQAWNEFNWNGGQENNPYAPGVTRTTPEYKEFCSSFMQADGFLNYSNQAIFATKDSYDFLKGIFSNMPDLITADISGVCRALIPFALDSMNLGKAINLQDLENFGKPSTLLKTIYTNNAVTQELTLALLSAGLSEADVDNIGYGLQPVITSEQEKQIYGAFLIIVDDNLRQVLIPLNVKTTGLFSLADLLNVKKMFPSCYQALTVPIYNDQPGPTNSKTYYPIFVNEDINSALTSPAIAEKVGNLSPPGTPLISDITSQTSTTEVNVQAEPIGFGSNLVNILPNSAAISAGAFSYSMRQIKNIAQVDFQRAAQVFGSLETNVGLPLTNGTDVPVNQDLATTGLNTIGLGSGPYGSYTMSDFFGCMSGLPYAWADILEYIKRLETIKLYNIYNQLFLAVTWEQAEFNITQPNGYNTTRAYVPPTIESNGINPTYNTDGSTRSAGSFVIGLPYNIVSLGTTTQPQWNIIAGTSGQTYAPGSAFVCANNGFGLGTGTAAAVVDTNRYINPVTGKTNAPTRYTNAGLPELYEWWYEVRITFIEDGGGYFRGKAPPPAVTISPNNVKAVVTTNVGIADEGAQSCGGGTFGRLINVNINNGIRYVWKKVDTQPNWNNSILVGQNVSTAPAPTTPIYPPRDQAWVQANMPYENISVQHPPTAILPILENGAFSQNGQNTPGAVYNRDGRVNVGTIGWPEPMNSVTQAYINQANEEIKRIYDSATLKNSVRVLNEDWWQLGRQLVKEQRSRFIAIPPVSIPRDPWVNQYPTTLYVFTDSIPTYAQQTQNHMQNMTLEAIANLETIGGQSVVAQGRQERNQTRLQEIGIPLDNNLADSLPSYSRNYEQELALNGTFQGALPSEGITNINTSTSTWLPPAWVTNYDAAGNLIAPRSPFNYDTTEGVVVGTGDYVAGSTLSIVTTTTSTAVVGTKVVTGPYYTASTFDYTNLPGGGTGTGGTGTGGTGIRNTPICDDDEPVTSTNVNLDLRTGQRVNVNTNTLNAVASTLSDALLNNATAGPVADNLIECGTLTEQNTNITRSPRVNRGVFASITPSFPGSFAYAEQVLPTNLDLTFMSGSVLPSTSTVDEAIATVIECNCDCWVT